VINSSGGVGGVLIVLQLLRCRTEATPKELHSTGQDRTGQDRTGQDRTGQDERLLTEDSPICDPTVCPTIDDGGGWLLVYQAVGLAKKALLK
jgi:hypothetical protein